MKHGTAFGVLEVPDPWLDQTVVQFYSPPVDAPVMDVVQTGQAAPPAQTRGFVSLTRAMLGKSTLTEFVAARELELKNLFPSLEWVARAAWAHPDYGDLPSCEGRYLLTAGVSVQQLCVFFPESAAHAVTVMSFGSHASTFDLHRPSFERIFRSFRHS